MSSARRFRALFLVGTLAAGLLVTTADPAAATSSVNVANLGVAQDVGPIAVPFGAGFAFQAGEAANGGLDRNGDGDATDDSVLHVYSPTAGVTNLGLDVTTGGNEQWVEVAGRLAFTVDEVTQGGIDRNGDGDATDTAVWHIYDPASGTTNLGVATSFERAWLFGDSLAFYIDEAAQGSTDLNGDGDSTDIVWHVWNPTTGVTNLALASPAIAFGGDQSIGDAIVLAGFEFGQGADLNGDGDSTDAIVWHIYSPALGLVNLGLAGSSGHLAFPGGMALAGSEPDEGTDLNGDGDSTDTSVWHVYEPASGVTNLGVAGPAAARTGSSVFFGIDEAAQGNTDLNGDGDTADTRVWHVYEAATGLTNLSLATTHTDFGPVGDGAAFVVDESGQSADLNGDGDTADDVVWHIYRPGPVVTNLGLAGRAFRSETYFDDGVAFIVDEANQGAIDRNGDGDSTDEVVHAYTISSGVANLGHAASLSPTASSGDAIIFRVAENLDGGISLNGDADASDNVLHAFDPSSGVTNLGLASGFPRYLYPVGSGISFGVTEAGQGATDLNGDGDTIDAAVLHVYDPGEGVTNLGLATERITGFETTAAIDDGLAFVVHEPLQGALDHNGDGDAVDDGVWHVVDINHPPAATADGYSTTQGTALAVNGVLANDQDPEDDQLTAELANGPSNGNLALHSDGSFTYTPHPSFVGVDSFSYRAFDGEFFSQPAAVTITVIAAPIVPTDPEPIVPSDPEPIVPSDVGLVDPSTGRWHLRNHTDGGVTSFFYGDPNDIPFMGDWDCDGIDTPGLFRRSDAFAYLRNSNTQGIADIRFYFGNPDDTPIPGDFNGDGCDTLSLYRPGTQEFFIINKLGENDGGLGAADFSILFGNPGDKPVVGDWDGDGITEVGLHRETTGFFYWRDTLTTGIASGQIFFGDPNDRFVAGDWGIVDGVDTPAIFRPADATYYFRNTLTEGIADSFFPFGEPRFLPVAGRFGLG